MSNNSVKQRESSQRAVAVLLKETIILLPELLVLLLYPIAIHALGDTHEELLGLPCKLDDNIAVLALADLNVETGEGYDFGFASGVKPAHVGYPDAPACEMPYFPVDANRTSRHEHEAAAVKHKPGTRIHVNHRCFGCMVTVESSEKSQASFAYTVVLGAICNRLAANDEPQPAMRAEISHGRIWIGDKPVLMEYFDVEATAAHMARDCSSWQNRDQYGGFRDRTLNAA